MLFRHVWIWTELRSPIHPDSKELPSTQTKKSPSLTGAKKASISVNFFDKKCNFQARQGGDPFGRLERARVRGISTPASCIHPCAKGLLRFTRPPLRAGKKPRGLICFISPRGFCLMPKPENLMPSLEANFWTIVTAV